MSFVSPHKILICPLTSLFIMTKNFKYFFTLCMAKANLTSTTSLRMKALLSVADKLHHLIAA